MKKRDYSEQFPVIAGEKGTEPGIDGLLNWSLRWLGQEWSKAEGRGCRYV